MPSVIDRYTNDEELWCKLQLDAHDIVLWNADKILDTERFDWKNIEYLFIVSTGGIIPKHDHVPCKVWYFDSTVDPLQKNLTTHLKLLEYVKGHFLHHRIQDHLVPLTNKNYDKLFDALLGLQRPHRDFVYDWINKSTHKERWFLTYYKKNGNWQAWKPGFWPEERQPFGYSGDQVPIPGHGAWNLSYIVPAMIYNQTVFSLVAETSGTGKTVPTEKLWKPILCRRLFVVISNQHYLKNIRSLGFKTFHDVIDESYDDISDDEARWKAAMEQCDWLCMQDTEEVVKACQNVLQHNFDLAMQDHTLSLEQEIIQVTKDVLRR